MFSSKHHGSNNLNRFFGDLGFANINPGLVRKKLPGKNCDKVYDFIRLKIIKHSIRLHSNRYSFTWLQITIYIAEFWNTITNLSMIVPALYGLSNVLRQGLERRYLTNLEHNSNQLMLFILYHDSFNLVDEYFLYFIDTSYVSFYFL